jgi:hypothetical protein
MSSGADFFDSIGTGNSSRTKSKDLFEEFGYKDAQSTKGKEHTPTVLTSASLFGGDKSSGGVANEGDGGWGDWNEGFDATPTAPKVCKSVLLCTSPFIFKSPQGSSPNCVTAVI